jgi:hypothetical protein
MPNRRSAGKLERLCASARVRSPAARKSPCELVGHFAKDEPPLQAFPKASRACQPREILFEDSLSKQKFFREPTKNPLPFAGGTEDILQVGRPFHGWKEDLSRVGCMGQWPPTFCSEPGAGGTVDEKKKTSFRRRKKKPGV